MNDRKPSPCAAVEEILVDTLRGRGRSADLEPHLGHIRDCGDCSALQGVARRAAADGLGSVPDPGADYWREFLPRLEARLRAGTVRPFRRTAFRVAVMSIAAALLFAFAWMLLRPGERTSEADRLEARLDEILQATPEHLGSAETILGEVLPDDPAVIDWVDAAAADQEDRFEAIESDWVLATGEIEDVRDLVGSDSDGWFYELDEHEMRELLRQLQEELQELIDEVPEARREYPGPEFKEVTI